MTTNLALLFGMAMPRISRLDMLVGGSTFLLVLAAWFFVVVLWHMHRSTRQRAILQRLDLDGPSDPSARILRLWRGGREAVLAVPGAAGWSLADRLEELRQMAGWRTSITTVALGLLAAMLTAFAAALLWTQQIPLALLAPVVIVPVFWIYVKRCINVHAATFDRQLLDALDLAVRSLRANHPLLGALQLVSEEIPGPVGPLFGRVCQQQALGMSLEESLRQVAETTRHPEFRLFATSVATQLRSGGHLADMMARLAHVIRDRLRLNRRVRVLTAQVQLSKQILLAMPFVMFLILYIISPDYISVLYTTPIGRIMLAGGAISLTAGTLLMNRMARLQY